MPNQHTGPDPIAQRFWAKVDKLGPVVRTELGPCWVWTGSRSRGYGQLSSRRGVAPHRAHVVSWELHYGPITDDLWVLHHCDNPPCVRPDHLFLGDQSMNMRDMVSKGRRIAVKLSDPDALEIRRRYTEGGTTYVQLAREFGVNWYSIYRVVKRKSWQHV